MEVTCGTCEEKRNSSRRLLGKREGNKARGKSKYRWQKRIKINI
jgi:hypothetical protein